MVNSKFDSIIINGFSERLSRWLLWVTPSLLRSQVLLNQWKATLHEDDEMEESYWPSISLSWDYKQLWLQKLLKRLTYSKHNLNGICGRSKNISIQSLALQYRCIVNRGHLGVNTEQLLLKSIPTSPTDANEWYNRHLTKTLFYN